MEDLEQTPNPTVLAHLYRGELSRKVAYRVRLDTTTNWAIGLSAAMGSFALSHREIPHPVLLFAVTLDLFMLWVEARRYRAYQLARHRVRLLEAHLLGETAEGRASLLARIRDSYARPAPPGGVGMALAQRVRRNYLWLVIAVLVGWLFKLQVHGGNDLVLAARVGPIPGGLVLGLAALLLVGLLLLTWLAPDDLVD